VVLLEGIRRESTLQPGERGAGHSMCSGGLGQAMVGAIGWPMPREVRMAEIHRILFETPSRSFEVSDELLGIEGPLGVVTNRKRFDDWLLSKALKLGAHYEQRARVTLTARDRSGAQPVWRLTTQDGRAFAARSLVGADGPESRIAAEHLGAPPVRDEDMYLGTEVYVRSSQFPRDAIMVRFQTSRLLGYYWAFQGGQVIKVGCGSSRSSGVQVSRENDWWRERLSAVWGDEGFLARPLEHVGGRITCSPPLVKVADAAGQVAIVGEAARAVLASAGAGDAYAVETGRALGRALALGDLSLYQKWWGRSVRPLMKRHYRFKRILMGLSDDEMDRLIGTLSHFRPRTSNIRREVPRAFAYLLRKQPLLVGRVAVRAALA